MTATTTVRCDRCDRAYLHLEPAAGSRVYADNVARDAGWTVKPLGPITTHLCPRCAQAPPVAIR